MKFKTILLFLTVYVTTFYTANSQENNVLFTVDDEPVYASEFAKVYNKNLDLIKDESQKDVNSYLELFINYKLKLKEAKSLKLDEKPTYLKELDGYKKQLAKNYLTNNKVTNVLVEEAYNRLKTEVNASHILVKISEAASPSDTLKAYNKILKLKERVLKEGYKNVQKEVHNGRTIYAEDLGYFTAFKMVYPFENAAYNTNVGEVSQPFRTRFGYHVITVFDKRKARGQVSVAHIMINSPQEKQVEGSEIKIKEIYKRLQQGEAFDALAKQLSEDKSSAQKGGVLKPFSSGELSSSKFEEVAFGLKKVNDISKPFKTKFGWHIVKLKAKQNIEPLEKMKAQLENKIKRDSRSKVINDSRIKTLKAKYTITENKNVIEEFKVFVDINYLYGRKKGPENFKTESIFKINDKEIKTKAFAEYLLKSYRGKRIKSIDGIVETSYSKFLESELLKYQEENLINENQDYAQIVDEYRDGLLLFDLMETKIWNVAKNDSIGLKTFFNNNKSNYYFSERVDAIVASSAKKKTIKTIVKLLEQGDTVEAIKKQVNTNNKVNVSFTIDEMEKEHQALPKTFSFKKGVSKIYKHNDAYVVVKVNEILPKKQKTFKEAKGQLSSDFQEVVEEKWLKTLASKYTVKVNEDVLTMVKKQLK